MSESLAPEPALGSSAWLLFLTICVAWGLNYLFVVIGLGYASPLWLAAARASVGFGGIAAFLLAIRHTRALDARARRDALLLGLPNTAAFLGLWFVAAQSVPAGETAILIYTFPLWVALLSPWVLGHRLTGRHWAAIGIGFGGIVLISQPWALGAGAIQPLPFAELLGAAICWAAGTVLMQRRFHGAEQMREANLYQLGGGAAALVVLAGLVNGQQLPQPTFALGLAIVWLGVIGTAYAYGAWYFLLSRIRASTLAAYTFLVPLVTLIAASIAFQERFTAFELAGMGLVLGSIYLLGSAASARAPIRPAELPSSDRLDEGYVEIP